MIKIIITILILINILFLYFLNKKKIKNFFYKSKIKSVDIEYLNKIFTNKTIDKNLSGPKDDVIVKNFCIPPNNNIVGMTSNYEAWIISSLSTISKKIFEFGTCSGKTTYLMSLNSPENSEIISLTLSPKNLNEIKRNELDNKISFRNILNESIYNNFLFTGSKFEKKIKVIFQNSLNFDESIYHNQFDLIFIDGGHTYSVIKNDSEKSFKMLKNNGIILWHDYVPGKESAKNVVKYIHNISKDFEIFHIKNTSLCYYTKKNTL